MGELHRTRNLTSLLKEHLSALESPDPLIESVAVNYLLTVAHSDIEAGVQQILVSYGSTWTDERGRAFVAIAAKRVVRSFGCGELAGVLGYFGESCKRHFQDLVNDTPQQLAYDRIVAGRHKQAHELGSDMTLADFETYLDSCDFVVATFSDSLQCSCHPS